MANEREEFKAFVKRTKEQLDAAFDAPPSPDAVEGFDWGPGTRGYVIVLGQNLADSSGMMANFATNMTNEQAMRFLRQMANEIEAYLRKEGKLRCD